MSQTIKEKIQQRRYQMLVHSYIYYRLDQNIISDAKWSEWAKELEQLQKNYPKESSEVAYADAFIDWDGSTGAFLPLDDEWIAKKAQKLIFKNLEISKNPGKIEKTKKKQSSVKKLF